jgi:hypothetical protein
MELPRLCVFCGKDESLGPLTKEHFVPKCLWARKRPQHTLTVPAHDRCNREYSDDNEYFRDVLAIGDNCADHPEVQKLLRGKIRRKLRARRGAFLKTLQTAALYPVYTASGLFVGHAPRFDWDWNRMETVLKNVMKGMFFSLMAYPMPQEMELYVGNVRNESDLAQIRQVVDAMSPWMGFGDDVFGCRAVFHSTGKYMYCLMRFYRSELFYGQGVLPTSN